MAMRHLVAEFGPPHSRHGDYRLRLKQVSLRDFGIQAALMRSMIETMKIAQHMPSTRTTPSRHTKADFDRTIALMEEMQRFELKELAFGKQELEEAIRRVTKGENELADFPRGGEFYGDDVAGQLINEHIADVTRKGGKVSFESPIMNDMHALQVADNMALIIPPKPLPRPRKAAVPLSLETLLP
jgi:hypothetical protein